MRKAAFIITAVALFLSGCSAGGAGIMREPDELEMIRTLGVDRSEKGFTVTAASGAGIDGSPPAMRTGDGITVDDAMEMLQKTSRGQEPFYSHTEHVIIGEELAESGIGEVLDFMARSSEMRIGTAVIVAKGMTANELMTTVFSEKSDIYGLLRVMEEESPVLGRGYMFTCLDVAAGLRQKGCALMLAAEAEASEIKPEDGEMTLKTAGFGIISGEKLTGYVPEEDAAGVILAMGKLRHMDLAVKTEGGRAGLSVERADTDVYPVFVDGVLEKLRITVSADVSLTEAGGIKSLLSDRTRQALEKGAANELFSRLKNALLDAQEAKIDYLGLGEAAEMRAPLEFRSMKTPFSELFPDIGIELSVTALLRRSYDLEEPLIP